MSSQQSQINNLASSFDMFEASAQAMIAKLRAQLNQKKEEEKMTKGRCSHCGKDRGDSLKSCSRCKAARYCDQTCQLADFKARHKRECANFTHPPTTSAFLTKPLPNERFAQQPVFAHGHSEGVGFWVTCAGRVDCDLQSLIDPVSPRAERYSDRQQRIFAGSADQGREIIRTHKASTESLIQLSVLVQNRRKDKGAVLVYGSKVQVVPYPSTTAIAEGGAAPQGENLTKFTRDRISYVAIGVANDPWDKCPRLDVSHFNGQEINPKQQLPSAVKDAKEGVVALNVGDFAIINLQFRVGDGERVSKDWEALQILESIRIPYIAWDGTTSPASLAPSLVLAQTPSPPTASAAAHEVAAPAGSLRANFSQPAIRAHYADFLERGPDAYARERFGDARADAARGADDAMAVMGEALLGAVAREGNTGVLADRLRGMGMGDLADKVAARDA